MKVVPRLAKGTRERVGDAWREKNGEEIGLSLYFRILTEREKRVRQKSHGTAELQAYEERLKSIENKLHLLSNRGTCTFSAPVFPSVLT